MFNYKYFDDLSIELIDGDRGKNYPKNNEMLEKGYCLFLNAKNVTLNGFVFDENVFITKEKDEILRKGKLNRNDIVLTTRGTIGNVGLYDDKITYDNVRINSGMLIIRNNDNNINTKYLYYQLTSPFIRNQIFSLKTGSAQPQIPITVLKKLKLIIPDKRIQDKIVRVMDSIINELTLNNEINNNLYELSDNLYNEWFVKFNFPKFDGKLKESELGMIPEKWNVGYFDDGILTKIIKSGVQNFDGFKRYIATADVTNTDITNYTLVDYDNKPSRANMTPIKSSVWFAKMENSIKNILVDDYMGDILNNYIFSTGFMGMECFKNSVNYIWSIINNRKFIDIKNSLSTGTLMAGISNTTIVNFKYLIPDEETLLQYNLKLREINRKIYNNKKQNETLKQLRDALLPKLMNGEIDLNNIEI